MNACKIKNDKEISIDINRNHPDIKKQIATFFFPNHTKFFKKEREILSNEQAPGLFANSVTEEE